MKQNKKGMVEIPAVTLNVLKKLVFDNNGVDMSPVIEDLSIGCPQEGKDLIAINVALTMKGLKPDLDIAKVTYKADWRHINIMIYQGFSLIHGVASFKVIRINWVPEGWVEGSSHNEMLALDQLDNLCIEPGGVKMQGIKEDETPDMEAFAEFVKKFIPNNELEAE